MAAQQLRASRDRSGRTGVHVPLTHVAGGWHADLSFGTHGLTPEQSVAHRDHLIARHERKALRLSDLASLISVALPGGWAIIDATVRDVGTDGCELLCRAAKGTRRIETRRHFNDPSEVPAATVVQEMMRVLAGQANADSAVDAEHAALVMTALLGD